MDELVRATGTDGRDYMIRPMVWSLEKVSHSWDYVSRFNIFSDEVPKTEDGFLRVVIGMGAMWFEIIDLTDDASIGLMYLTDVIQGADNTLAAATWHAMLWDAKAGPRRPILQAGVRALFSHFGFHRLQAEIPCKHGGVIRAARKIGFVPEGRLRQARRYNGVWYDSIVMGLLEHEAVI